MGLGVFLVVATLAALPRHPMGVAAGSLSASSCSAQTAVRYATAYSPALPGYVVTRVPIRSAPACAHHRYELTVSDAYRHRAVRQGLLDARGSATATITGADVDAATVSVAVVITG